MIYLKLVFLVFFLIKSLDLVYLFQVKEYRLDRIKSMFNDENFWYIFYGRAIRLPAKSIRNFLIILLNVSLILFIQTLIIGLSVWVWIMMILSCPFLAFMSTVFGVEVTRILAWWQRRRSIKQAEFMIGKSKAIFIGITGSYGKTTTKEYLYQILSTKYKVAKTDANKNTDVGVALSVIKNLKHDTNFFIVEIGAYKRGEIKKVCNFIRPHYAIVTAIGNQHLDLFGSKENLIKAKKELLESLPQLGIAYINENIKEKKPLTENIQCQIKIYPASNNYLDANLTPCVFLAKDLGLKDVEIEKTIAKIKSSTHRLTLAKGKNSCGIINDSANVNVAGLLMVIASAKNHSYSKKYLMTRGIIELGKEKIISYQEILEKMDQTDFRLVTTDKLFKKLDRREKVIYFSHEKKLVEYLCQVLDKDTLLVIEGRFHPKTIQQLIK